jgi:hypothetical protein
MKVTLFVSIMAIFTLSAVCRVGDLELPYVSSAEIVSTWQSPGDFATLELPRSLRLGSTLLEDLVRPGAPAEIQLGYDGVLETRFKGYVARIHPETPLRIDLEDEIFLLKGTSYTKTFRQAELWQVIETIAGGMPYEAADVRLGAYVIKQASASEVLADLKSRYGLPCWFRDGTLHAGAAYAAGPRKHAYEFGRNVAASSLEYRRKEDRKILIKAVSIQADNSRIEATAGTAGGDVRTMHFTGIRDKESLKKLAESSLQQVQTDGFAGDITGFGLPATRHGDILEIRDPDFRGDRSGSYFIDKVRITFSAGGGYRHINTLGPRA